MKRIEKRFTSRGKRFVVALALALALGACRPIFTVPAATPSPTTAPAPTESPPPITPSATASATPTSLPTASPTATLTPVPTATPDPYQLYTIDHLSERSYGVGRIEIVDTLAENSWFTRYLIRYNSDDFWIYGFLNVPVSGGPIGDGPFPVLIALHGYIDPDIYQTIDYTTGYADALTRAGYIVFHPNLRGYPPSDSGDNLFRVGMAIDVLNLIALVQNTGEEMSALEQADVTRIGLWGHSMGGGVATRVLTVSRDIRAAVLYAAMSGDERQNFEAIDRWSGGERGQEELAAPLEALERISPEYFLDRISAAVSIHHGRADELVPLAWSVDTCNRLAVLQVEVECFFYPDMPHTFYGETDLEFIRNTIVFLDEALKGP